MKLKRLANLIILPAILGIACFAPIQHAFADDTICNNANISDEIKAASGCPSSTAPSTLPEVVTDILTAIIAVVGLISAIYIIIGGVQYMTSSGDTGKTEKGKKTILYALIGLIISALAFAIVNFVIRDIL